MKHSSCCTGTRTSRPSPPIAPARSAVAVAVVSEPPSWIGIVENSKRKTRSLWDAYIALVWVGVAGDLPKIAEVFFLCVRGGFENVRQMEYVKSSSEAFEIHVTSPHHWLHPIGSTRAVNPVSSSQRRQNSSVHSQQRNSYVSSLTPPHYPLEPLRL